MPNYKINNDKVLIVPGFTDDELIQNSNNKKSKKSTNKNNSKNNKKKSSGSSGSSDTTSTKKVEQPTSFFFEVHNVKYTPHIKSYEEFNSSEGLILIEKACDTYAEVEMDVVVNQQISNVKGKIMIDKQTREARLRVTDSSTLTKDTESGIELSRWVTPEEFTEDYLKIRNAFFEDLYGRPLTIVSPLFPAMPVAYLTECSYNIEEGTEEASYSVTFRETESLGI